MLIVQKSSKLAKVLCTVMSLVSTASIPALVHKSCSTSICDAAELGGLRTVRPIARISIRSGSKGNPPPNMSQAYAATAARTNHPRHLNDPLNRFGSKINHQGHCGCIERI